MARSGATASWGVLLMAFTLSLAGARDAHAQLGALVSPGRLARAHASLEGINNCLKCHTAGRGVSAEKCLTCHTPVAQRIVQKKGVHRNVTTDCVTCHVEHAGVDAELRPFNQQRFNHATDTGFPLGGLHATLANNCASCHKTRSFLTTSPSCASCHTDVHKGSLGPRCESCHTTSIRFSESRTKFDHSRTAFPLTGAHTSITCTACHTKGAATYKGIAFASCADCHADPHRQQLGATCTTCHTTQSWQTSRIDHSRTAFPLRGQHSSVQCVSCHVKPALQLKPRADTCAACHKDPHRGVFKQDCKSCHDESSFKKAGPSGFDHSSTRFRLVDAHAQLPCAACHTPRAPLAIGPRPAAAARETSAGLRTVTAGDFGGLKTDCVSCHTDVHRAELGTSCETCHTARTFQVATFKHARMRPFFDGQHATLRCAQCHTATYGVSAAPVATTTRGAIAAPTGRAASQSPVLRVGFVRTSETCTACHKDVHLGQVGVRCETCHSVVTPKFAVQSFQHSTTTFPLTGKHTAVACQSCHTVATQDFPAGHGTARRLKGMGTECASCHQDPHDGKLGTTCQSCHSTDTFSFSGKWYPHANRELSRTFFTGRHITACAACHKPGRNASAGSPARVAYVIPTSCTSCHTDVHRGALGPRCESCHKP
ncbi:MAG TPA: hypothetical protein VGF24_20425 [Vicinamibacterales bacterium]